MVNIMIDKDKLKQQIISAILNSNDLDNSINNINKVLNSYKRKNKRKNILLTQLNAMGDLILAIPAIREIRKNYPDAHITLIYFETFKDIVKYLPYVDELIPSNISHINLFNFLLHSINFCYEHLWNRTYDLAINLHFSCNVFIGSIIQWLSITKENIGYSFEAERQYYHKDFSLQSFLDLIQIDKFILTKSIVNPFNMYHELDRKMYILEACGLQVTSKKLELFLDQKSIIYAKNILKDAKRKIIIGLASSNNTKRYSVQKLLIALKEIVKDNNTLILLGAGKQEIKDAKYLKKHIQCINLVNKTSVLESMAVIQQSDLYIGNDTGLMHIAEVFNKSIIYYLPQAKDKNNIHIGSLSARARFHPTHNKYILLQPETSLDDCLKYNTYNGCISTEAHCINQIDPYDIIKAYYKIKEKFLS